MDIAVLSQRADEIYWSSLSPSSSVNAVDSFHAVNTPSSQQNRRAQRSQHPPSWYYPPFHFSLGLSTTYGQEERWRMETLRRLPPSQHCHHS